MWRMDVEIIQCPPERLDELLRTSEIGFSEDAPDDLRARVRKVADPARFLGGVEDGRFVSTAGVFSMKLSVPGGELPAGGVTWVTVLPSHRRQGILSRMMRLMIDDCHARNEPLAILWASEAAIYQRFGYGLGTWSMNLDADTVATRIAGERPAGGSFRLIPAGQGMELVAPIYDAARSGRAGFLSRSPDWWVGQLPLVEKDAKGGEAKRLVVYDGGSGPEAYAVYKTKADWSVRGPNVSLTVEEAIGSTAAGTREIWRYLFAVDLVRTLKVWRLPRDHAILGLVAEPRRLGVTMGDGLWVRIVDVRAALEGRTYGVDGKGSGVVSIDLRDDFCPWNAGRWKLDVGAGHARASRTDEPADLALDANALASLFLGGFSATTLVGASAVEELRPGGLATADALFPTPLQPWCPQEF
jgi:predicted acetyltransferase